MKANDFDEVAFDYLEGNLLPEERDAFELLMSESEIISHEVKLLKAAYFHESLPTVTALEEKLFRHDPHSTAPNILKKILGIGLIISPVLLSVFSTSMERFPTAEAPSEAIPVQDIPAACIEPAHPTKQFASRQYHTEAIAILDGSTANKKAEPSLEEKPAQVNTDLLKGDMATTMTKQLIIVKPVTLTKTSIRKLSAKEIRSINRKKRREYQRQMETKFMKGNEPYVVPLKNSNF